MSFATIFSYVCLYNNQLLIIMMLRYFITILLIFGSLSIFAQINVPRSKGNLILLVKDKKKPQFV